MIFFYKDFIKFFTGLVVNCIIFSMEMKISFIFNIYEFWFLSLNYFSDIYLKIVLIILYLQSTFVLVQISLLTSSMILNPLSVNRSFTYLIFFIQFLKYIGWPLNKNSLLFQIGSCKISFLFISCKWEYFLHWLK